MRLSSGDRDHSNQGDRELVVFAAERGAAIVDEVPTAPFLRFRSTTQITFFFPAAEKIWRLRWKFGASSLWRQPAPLTLVRSIRFHLRQSVLTMSTRGPARSPIDL